MDTEAKIFYYLGANTPVGFYSLYDELIDLERARDVRILKGGPGCGKSTLMRQVGEAMEERGHTVEYIRCSGDPDSLDGVVIPALGAAVVDGTAPHVIEPRYPGLVERYVDLGAFCDRAALRGAETELKACMKSYKACYRRAYRCLTAAAQLEEDMLALLLVPGLEAKLAKRARGILSREVRREGEQEGRVVRRFLGGVTWKGVLREYGTVEAQCGRVYELTDPYGLAHPMLTCLAAGPRRGGLSRPPFPGPAGPPADPRSLPGLCQHHPGAALAGAALPPHPAGRHGRPGAAPAQPGAAAVLPQGGGRSDGGGGGGAGAGQGRTRRGGGGLPPQHRL